MFPQTFIKCIRHSLNIGAGLNVTRGFEFNASDYVWILSDDDEISAESLATLAHEVGVGEHDIYYLISNIKGDQNVADGMIIHSQREYLQCFSSLSMMGLISANIYTVRLAKYIEYMHLYGYTLFPHVAAVLRFMEFEKFSLKCIGGGLIKWNPNQNSYGHIYEMALTNVLFLAELIQAKNNRKIFLAKHIQDFGVSHFFPLAIKNCYNFKKAWIQVGAVLMLYSGVLYVQWHFLKALTLLFPNAYARYRARKGKISL